MREKRHSKGGRGTAMQGQTSRLSAKNQYTMRLVKIAIKRPLGRTAVSTPRKKKFCVGRLSDPGQVGRSGKMREDSRRRLRDRHTIPERKGGGKCRWWRGLRVYQRPS